MCGLTAFPLSELQKTAGRVTRGTLTAIFEQLFHCSFWWFRGGKCFMSIVCYYFTSDT